MLLVLSFLTTLAEGRDWRVEGGGVTCFLPGRRELRLGSKPTTLGTWKGSQSVSCAGLAWGESVLSSHIFGRLYIYLFPVPYTFARGVRCIVDLIHLFAHVAGTNRTYPPVSRRMGGRGCCNGGRESTLSLAPDAMLHTYVDLAATTETMGKTVWYCSRFYRRSFLR